MDCFRSILGNFWKTAVSFLLVLGILSLSASIFAEESSSESEKNNDFFAEEVQEETSNDSTPSAAENKTQETPSDQESAQAKNSTPSSSKSAISNFVDSFFNRGKEEENKESLYKTPLENVLPAESLMTFQTIPIISLNKKLGGLLNNLGFGKITPLGILQFSAYGDAVNEIDLSRPLGACWLVNRKAPIPVTVLLVPIRHFNPFAAALGGDVPPETPDSENPSGQLWTLKTPSGWICAQREGYALLLKEEDAWAVEFMLGRKPLGQLALPNGFSHSDFQLTVAPAGIKHFPELSRVLLREAFPLLNQTIKSLEEKDIDLQLDEKSLNTRLNNFNSWINKNLTFLRFEGKIENEAVLTSFSFIPRPNSELQRQLQDKGGPRIPTLLNGPEFLSVLPATPSALTGQMDLLPDMTARLEPPFNRVRHLEYSFAYPNSGELLAESWSFFLEVDDSDAFVKELIIPKAQLIGSHIGSDRVGQIAGEFLGNLSLRRQAMGRRPLLFDSPEEAAEAGRSLGSQIGGEIGSSIGEKEAMKDYDFEGYKLYISDLVLYTQQMREIRARQEGKSAPDPIFLTGEPTFRSLIANSLAGLQSGSLEGVVRNQMGKYSGNSSQDDPLLARQNLILILDKTHLLIVPGNQEVLRAGIKRWETLEGRLKKIQNGYISQENITENDWRFYRDLLYKNMNSASSSILRSAARFNMPLAQKEAQYIRKNYAPDFPVMISEPLPLDLPSCLFLSTQTNSAGFFYSALPDSLLKIILRSRLDNSDKKTKK